MPRRPPGFWKIKANRVDAIKAMVEKSGRGVREITKRDFKAYGLDCLLEDYYSNDSALAVKEVFEGGEKMRKSIKVKAKASKPAPVAKPEPKASSQQCCEPICGPDTCQ